MARAKFQTLTEQMFYILLCMNEKRCGMDVMELVREMTEGRIVIGAGTMYTLLADFEKAGMIQEVEVEGRKRSYVITEKGRDLLHKEYLRIKTQIEDFERVMKGEKES